MLFAKIRRDFRQNISQFFSVFLMSFICLFIFTGIYHLSRQMEQTADAFISDSHLADATLTVLILDQEKITATAELTGSNLEQRSVAHYESSNYDLTLLSFDETTISRPLLIQGTSLSSQEGIWMSEDFFTANKLQLGADFTIGQLQLPILGTVKQPEFVYFTASNDQPLPNHQETSYAYLSQATFDQLSLYSQQQLLLKTGKVENQAWFEEQLTRIWDSDFQQLTWQQDAAGLKTFTDRGQQVRRLALLFSGLFLLLTLITMEATMRRFVSQQQTIIGSFKALGLTNPEILRHYLLLGGLIALMGSLLGCLLGPLLLAPALLEVIGTQFSVPQWHAVQDYSGYLLALLLTILCLLVIILPLRSLLTKEAATILQKQPPVKKQRLWLERFRLWQKLPFSLQWTLRDIQRNLGRGLLGIFGAVGCMVLLTAAFGIRDSIEYSLANIFDDTYHYQDKVQFQQPLTAAQQTEAAAMADQPSQYLQQTSLSLLNGSQKITTTATILSEGQRFTLKNLQGESLDLAALTDNQVVIAQGLAQQYNWQQHDTIYLQHDQQIQAIYLAEIADISAPQGIFTSQEVWQQLQYPFAPQSLLVAHSAPQALLDLEYLSSQTSRQQQKQDSEALLEGILMIVSLLILAALVLGITIMMNCHLLIFSQRFLEFATLKVLGFTQREVLQLSLLETSLLTLAGWLVSLPLGWQFLKIYVTTVSTENQRYLPHLSLNSFLLASLILLLCMLIVQGILNRRIRQIDFATALKPAE